MAAPQDVQQAIEMAVRIVGQQAITDLERQIGAVRTQIQGYDAALAAGTLTTGEYIANTQQLQQQMLALQQGLQVAQAAMGSFSAKFAQLGPLSISAAHAFQDFTSANGDLLRGLSATLNNIPMLAEGFARLAGVSGGAAQGIAASLSVLAVIAVEVARNWDRLSAALGLPQAPKLIGDIKAIEAALKTLEAKTWKTAVDFSDIDIAKDKLRQLKAEEAEYERLKSAKTTAQQEAGKLATEAIVEQGGGVDRVADALAATRPITLSPEMQQVQAKIAEYDAIEREDPAKLNYAERNQRDNLRRWLEPRIAALKENRDWGASQTVRQAAGGDEAAIQELIRAASANEAGFAAQGAGPGFVPMLMRGTRSQIRDRQATENSLAIQKDQEQQGKAILDEAQRQKAEDERKAKEAGAEFAKKVTEAARSVQAGFLDTLTDELFKVAEGKGDVDGAVAARRAGLMAQIEGRGITADGVASGAADKILADARDAALNAVNSGRDPRLERERSRAAEAARQKAEREAAAESKKEVADLVRGFGPANTAELQQAILTRRTQGESSEQAAAGLQGQVQQRLIRGGANGEDANAAATAILRKASETAERQSFQAGGPAQALMETFNALTDQMQKQAIELQQIQQFGMTTAQSMRAMRLQQGNMANQRPPVAPNFFGPMGGVF